jgi:MFS superfamily sulfate permease-like transporter
MTGVVLLGTLEGILVAVAVSVLVLIREANHPPVYVLGRRRGTSVFEAVSPTDSDVETFPGLLLMRTEGRIHFANAHRVGEQIWSLIHEGRPRVVALEMGAVPDLEYTALQALTDAEKKLQEAGMTLWLVALNRRVREVISRSPLGEVVTGDRIFPTAAHAVDAYTRLTSETSSRPSTGRPDVAGAGGVD